MHFFQNEDLFNKLFNDLDSTTKTSEKVQIIVRYLAQASEPDKLMLTALFTGRRPKRIVKLAHLKQWAMETTNTPEWLFAECYAVVGDLAETISLLVANSNQRSAVSKQHSAVSGQLSAVSTQPSAESRQLIAVSSEPSAESRKLIADSRLPFIKLLTGGFRLGVSQAILVQALNIHTGIEKDELNLRLMGNWTVQNTTYHDLLISPKPHLQSTKPYPFFLASPFNEDPTESELSPLTDFQIEPKWDGIRAQIIKRNGAVNLWSRGEEIISEQFPELVNSVVSWDAFSGAVDGEILCWDFENKLPRPFQDLQKRLGRKSPGKKTLTDYPIVFLAYDLLELNAEDIRNHPLKSRREQLEHLFQESPENLQISPVFHPSNYQELIQLRLNSPEMRSEGLMIKRTDSAYGIGRKRGDWWKWKVEPDTVDAVLIYAQRGHGRRANLYTDFTFAVYKGTELVPFAKAYSGLTDSEILEVNQWIKTHTRESFGPVKSVDAELVFELAFEGINHSPRHKSGIAVRFPRIVRWRRDKSVKDIATIEELTAKLP